MSKPAALFVFVTVLCALSTAIPLRNLLLRSYDDFNQSESVAAPYFAPETDYADNADTRPKRGLDLLKRRVEIIERNRCFFNPITCY